MSLAAGAWLSLLLAAPPEGGLSPALAGIEADRMENLDRRTRGRDLAEAFGVLGEESLRSDAGTALAEAARVHRRLLDASRARLREIEAQARAGGAEAPAWEATILRELTLNLRFELAESLLLAEGLGRADGAGEGERILDEAGQAFAREVESFGTPEDRKISLLLPPAFHALKAEAVFRRGDVGRALSHLDRAIGEEAGGRGDPDRNAERLRMTLRKAEILADAMRTEPARCKEALETVDRFLAEVPADEPLHARAEMVRGRILERRGDREGALGIARGHVRLRVPPGSGWRAIGGGAPGNENPVELGLKWLSEHQEEDGRVASARHEGEAGADAEILVSGLAALSYLGANYTDEQGKYAAGARRLLDWLESRQDEGGSFAGDNVANGVCALALAEAHAITGRRSVAAQRAVDAVAYRQLEGGGWAPDVEAKGQASAGDPIASFWNAAVLESGERSRLVLPPSALDRAYGYSRGAVHAEIVANRDPTRLAAAVAGCLVLRARRGFALGDPVLLAGGRRLCEMGPRLGAALIDLRYDHFSSLALRLLGREWFDAWNQGMRDPLVAYQVRDAGDAQGSWRPERDAMGGRYGRAYSTVMGYLTLEVYYGYLPVFGR